MSELTKSYGRGDQAPVINNLSLEFPSGRCTVLLGPSGCGKTTILRSIAGLIRPDHGRVMIGDTVMFDARTGTEVPPEKRQLGMVFQSYALWPHLTVGENVAYPLRANKLPRSEAKQRAEAMLKWVGLDGMAARYPHELSGGQQQRVSVARAMAGEPRAILFDEPLSNLDAQLREGMRMQLLALRENDPYTAVYVTHDQIEAMTLGDNVVVLNEGRIEQTGAPEHIYRRPRTRFVARFVGIPNLLSGTVQAVSGEDIIVATPLGNLPTRSWRGDWRSGQPCTVAARPTLITLGEPDDHAQATGRVVRSIFQGDTTIELVEVNGATITVQSLAEHRHPPNTAVSVRPTSQATFALLDD